MKADYNFNRRAAKLIDVNGADVSTGISSSLGVRITLFANGSSDVLRIHLTPVEARRLAESLLSAANRHGEG